MSHFYYRNHKFTQRLAAQLFIRNTLRNFVVMKSCCKDVYDTATVQKTQGGFMKWLYKIFSRKAAKSHAANAPGEKRYTPLQ